MSQGGSVNSGFAENIAKQQKQLSQPFGTLTTMFDDLDRFESIWSSYPTAIKKTENSHDTLELSINQWKYMITQPHLHKFSNYQRGAFYIFTTLKIEIFQN